MARSSPRIFVSHSHEDDEMTAQFTAALKSAGADVWVDAVGDSVGIDQGDFLEKINQALALSDWLALILTPTAVRSPWVRMEVNAALAMAHDQGSRMHEPILVLAKPCTAADIPPLWRPLHYHDAVSNYQAAIAGLLRALDLASNSIVAPSPAASNPAGRPTIAQTIPPQVIRAVDSTGGRDYTSLAEAIQASDPGDRIWVYPGRYSGVLHIDKELEILGVGRVDQVILEGTRQDLIDFRAEWGRIANLMLVQHGGGQQSAAIGLNRGQLELEGCDITSGNFGLFLYSYATVNLYRCHIHDCGGVGISLNRRSNATVDESAITGNGGDALMVWEGSSVVLRRSRITGNSGVAIRLSARSRCIAEDNDLRDNARSWHIVSGRWDLVQRARNRED